MRSLHTEPRDRPVIELTPAMIEAGVWALLDSRGSSPAFQAKSVFEAMIEVVGSMKAGPQEPPAS